MKRAEEAIEEFWDDPRLHTVNENRNALAKLLNDFADERLEEAAKLLLKNCTEEDCIDTEMCIYRRGLRKQIRALKSRK